MTSMIDPGLLVTQEFQLAQEETLSFKRSPVLAGLLFCPQVCVSRGHGSPRVLAAVVTGVTFLHNLCHQLLSPEHYVRSSQMAPAPQARAPMPHLTVVKTRLEFPHLGLT